MERSYIKVGFIEATDRAINENQTVGKGTQNGARRKFAILKGRISN
jgi:hypothetical protein